MFCGGVVLLFLDRVPTYISDRPGSFIDASARMKGVLHHSGLEFKFVEFVFCLLKESFLLGVLVTRCNLSSGD